MVHVSGQNKSSEVVQTENLKELSWSPACSYPGSDRGSLNHFCLIFTHREREESQMFPKMESVGAGSLLGHEGCNGRTRVEQFASPELDRKVVCSLLHKAVLQLNEQQFLHCFMVQRLT